MFSLFNGELIDKYEKLEEKYNDKCEEVNKYKEYLQQQTDDLKNALNDRKNAYQKYFDAINQEYEDQDYEEQQQLLIENLGKIGAGTDATSMAKIASLESTLKENEKERRETLRQRAQDVLLNSLDDQVKKNKKSLEEQLKNEDNLLTVIQSASFGKNIFNGMLAAITENGKLPSSQYNSITELITTMVSAGADLSKLDGITVIATGPLTSDALFENIRPYELSKYKNYKSVNEVIAAVNWKMLDEEYTNRFII